MDIIILLVVVFVLGYLFINVLLNFFSKTYDYKDEKTKYLYIINISTIFSLFIISVWDFSIFGMYGFYFSLYFLLFMFLINFFINYLAIIYAENCFYSSKIIFFDLDLVKEVFIDTFKSFEKYGPFTYIFIDIICVLFPKLKK